MYLERVVRFEINNFVSLREKRTTKRVFFHSDFRNACVQIGFLVKVRSPEKKRGKREKPLVLHAVSVAEKRDYEIAIVVAQFFAYFLIFCSFFFARFLLVPHRCVRPSTSPISFTFFYLVVTE